MRRLVFAFLVSCLSAYAGQGEKRSSAAAEAERTARTMFSNGDYEKTVSLLERATADNPQDLPLLNLLGMAYLYSSSRIDAAANVAKVQPAMEKVIEGGGEAVFLVGKAIDKPKAKYVIKTVAGELRVSKDSLGFMPTRGSAEESVGPIAKADLKECGLNRGYGQDSATFRVKTAKTEFDFRPLHFSKDEANIACALIAKYLGAKISK